MKTIFVTAYYRQQVRDVLLSDVQKVLEGDSSIHTVFFVPSYRVTEYEKEFEGKNVIFEGVEDVSLGTSYVDALFKRISRYYVDSSSTRALLGGKGDFQHTSSTILLALFKKSKWLQNIARFLDCYLVRDKQYKTLFEKYKPSLVFLSGIDNPLDQALLRYAKMHRVQTVGTVSVSDAVGVPWHSVRLLPHKFVVCNESVKKFMMKYLCVNGNNIFVSGIPSFDRYISEPRTTREKFCEKVNVDPSKRIVLFVSVAAVNPTEYQVLRLLDDVVKAGRLPSDTVFLVRNHPIYGRVKGSLVKLDLEPSSNIVFDNSRTFFESGKTYKEGLVEDMQHEVDSLFHSDMIITTSSILGEEAALLNKPIVNLAFDGIEEKSKHESISRYYSSIEKYKGTKIAYDLSQLIRYVKEYFGDPTLDSSERRKMVEDRCFKLDGKSGKRIADFVTRNVDN
jgi:hypothetical protein